MNPELKRQIEAYIKTLKLEYDDYAFGELEFPCAVINANIAALEWVLAIAALQEPIK